MSTEAASIVVSGVYWVQCTDIKRADKFEDCCKLWSQCVTAAWVRVMLMTKCYPHVSMHQQSNLGNTWLSLSHGITGENNTTSSYIEAKSISAVQGNTALHCRGTDLWTANFTLVKPSMQLKMTASEQPCSICGCTSITSAAAEADKQTSKLAG